MDNELMGAAQPQESGSAPAPSALPPDPSGEHGEMLENMLTQAKAKLAAIEKTKALADTTRKEMDKLVALGEAVTTDDVLSGMAQLVGEGADPKVLIGIMQGGPQTPPMPEAGPALAQWVLQQDQMVAEREQALEEPLHAARYDVLTSAVHMIANHHIQTTKGKAAPAPAAGAPAPPPSAGPANPLMNSEPPDAQPNG